MAEKRNEEEGKKKRKRKIKKKQKLKEEGGGSSFPPTRTPLNILYSQFLWYEVLSSVYVKAVWIKVIPRASFRHRRRKCLSLSVSCPHVEYFLSFASGHRAPQLSSLFTHKSNCFKNCVLALSLQLCVSSSAAAFLLDTKHCSRCLHSYSQITLRLSSRTKLLTNSTLNSQAIFLFTLSRWRLDVNCFFHDSSLRSR